jgi:L-alanine-DL-glutamate epimerase-like enolase superfamily enzyme
MNGRRSPNPASERSARRDPISMSGKGIRIRRVETIEVQLPTRQDARWRARKTDLGNYVLVRVETEDGLAGVGEATVLPDWGGDFGRYYGEDPSTTAHIVSSYLGPAIVGRNPFDICAIHDAMDARVRGYPYAKAAVDIALYDVMGKAAGLPVHRLLGGRYRDEVALAHMIGIVDDQAAVQEASDAVDDGVRAFQVKGGESPSRDIRLIGALREALGNDVHLRLDANQGYADSKMAINTVLAMEPFRLDVIEQPVAGISALREVRRAVRSSVMADESCWSLQDGLEIIAQRAADLVSIYVAKSGGLLPASRLAATLAAAGIACDVNGSLETGIGTAANLHLAVSQAAVRLPCVICASAPRGRESTRVAGRYYLDDVIRTPLPYRDGRLQASDAPGLGVELDEEKVAAYRVGA